MRPYNGYKAERRSRRVPLPAGGYVVKILEAKEVEYDWGSKLQLSFDVVEGEHRDFFARDYREQAEERKKWRGTYRLGVPKDDGSDKDEWTKRDFNNAMACIEQSNPGFHWDWDEKTLVGKLVGVIYRNREWEMNGRTGWTTEAGKLTDIDDIRSGAFKPLDDKPLERWAVGWGGAAASTGWTEVDENDLPFH